MISTTSSQVNLRLQVCMGDVQPDVHVPRPPVWRVTKTCSPDDDVRTRVPFCSEWFAVFHLAWNSEPLQRAIDFMEKGLVLVHMRPGFATYKCVPGVHVSCIAAGAPYCHVLLDPYGGSSHSHELLLWI